MKRIEEKDAYDIKKELSPLLSREIKDAADIADVKLLLKRLLEIAQLSTTTIVEEIVLKNSEQIVLLIEDQHIDAFDDSYSKIQNKRREVRAAQRILKNLLIAIPRHEGGNERKLNLPDDEDFQQLNQEIMNFLNTIR